MFTTVNRTKNQSHSITNCFLIQSISVCSEYFSELHMTKNRGEESFRLSPLSLLIGKCDRPPTEEGRAFNLKESVGLTSPTKIELFWVSCLYGWENRWEREMKMTLKSCELKLKLLLREFISMFLWAPFLSEWRKVSPNGSLTWEGWVSRCQSWCETAFSWLQIVCGNNQL